ncbi:MAG: recombinase family protein [Alcaligenaceae bacterium]|nr:MAG: recombinase family protein [Alcaligenaceae bacterium]
MTSKLAPHEDGERAASVRAVEYVRMSTEHQQYSTVNQHEKIREYAAQRGIEVVKTYADEGKSGLRIDGRAALQRLIEDVQTGAADFSLILVYDISRWGRFQDADESAYYEYICKRAGIGVTYCAEQFENDGSPVSTIVKGVKRAMAGEYSRELSAKVFAGQCRLVELGFRQGGSAGYGLRRILLDQFGVAKGPLRRGEQKSLQTDRVILGLGPQNEVAIVQQIYRWFIEEGSIESDIAQRLNTAGLASDLGNAWTRATVHQVLTNDKYMGSNVYNRRSFKLKKLHVVNTPDMWIRKDDAFEPVVSRDTFYIVQGMIRARSYRYSDDELIERLRRLYEHRGFLSGMVIDETDGMPSSSVYSNRFGSLLKAYQLVGYTPDRDYQYVEINRFLRRMHPQIVAEAEGQVAALGGSIYRDTANDLLDVNHEFSVSIVLARCQQKKDCGRHRWKIRFDTGLAPDVTIAIRLSPGNKRALDYYLLPRLDFATTRLSLADQNAIEIESFRFDSLDYFYGMAARMRLRRAA